MGKWFQAVMLRPIIWAGWYPHQPYGTASVASQSRLVSSSTNRVSEKARQLMKGRSSGKTPAEGPRAVATRKVK